MLTQKTLKNSVQAAGVGTHSGNMVRLTLSPAPENMGICFVLPHPDTKSDIIIPARVENVSDTRMSTTLAKQGVAVATVEHLLSALCGLHIDNAYIRVEPESWAYYQGYAIAEIPIMDGSAAPYALLLESAGFREQFVPKRFIRIMEEVSVEVDGKYACLKPHHGFKVTFTIEYDHPAIQKSRQKLSLDFSQTSYVQAVSRARTYGFAKDYEELLRKNLAQGSSLYNSIVLDDYRVVNEDGLRYADEFVRHKILDAMGDLFLLGHSLIGEFEGYKSGHALNNLLLKTLLEKETAWEYVSFNVPDALPLAYLEPLLV